MHLEKEMSRKVLLRANNDDDLLNSAYLDSEGFISMFTKEDFFVDLNTICKEQVMVANKLARDWRAHNRVHFAH